MSSNIPMPSHIKKNFVYAKIFGMVHEYDSNADFIVIGSPGTGKSSLAQRICHDVDESFHIGRIVYSTTDLMKLVRYGDIVGKNKDGTPKMKRLKKGCAIIYDETAGSEEAADSRSALSKTNKTMSFLKTIYRDYKLIVFYIAPALSQIDKNIKLVATSGVFWTKMRDTQKKEIACKFYWSETNHLMGNSYYKKPRIVAPMNNNQYQVTKVWFPYSPTTLFKAYEKVKRSFSDEKISFWIGGKEEAEAEQKKDIKYYYEEAAKMKDKLKLDGKFDWGLVSARLGVGQTMSTKLVKMLTNEVEL